MVKLTDSKQVKTSYEPLSRRDFQWQYIVEVHVWKIGLPLLINSYFSLEVYAAREKNGVYIPKERYYQEESERKVLHRSPSPTIFPFAIYVKLVPRQNSFNIHFDH